MATNVDRVLTLATAQIGDRYVYGDEGPDTFDCSGLVQWVYGHVGIELPRTAHEQQAATAPVGTPLPGDLVFYGRPATHVGIYVGGGKMIDAPHPGATVRVDSVGTPTNYGRVSGLGALAAVPAGIAAGVAGAVGDVTSTILGSARYIALEAAAVVLGAALVGYGLWRASAPIRRSTLDSLGGSL
jgi:hypothetical protein